MGHTLSFLVGQQDSGHLAFPLIYFPLCGISYPWGGDNIIVTILGVTLYREGIYPYMGHVGPY